MRQTEGFAFPQAATRFAEWYSVEARICGWRAFTATEPMLSLDSISRLRSRQRQVSRRDTPVFRYPQAAREVELRSEGPTFGGSNFSSKRFSSFSSTAFIGGLVVLPDYPICVRLPVPPARGR